MQQFTIRDIENLTGIKAATLRIWEQRYPNLLPLHVKSKHRIYSNDELKKLLQIAFLYHSGLKISKIADLTDEAILKKSSEAFVEPFNYGLFITKLIEAAVDFNEQQFTRVLKDLTDIIGFEKCISAVCYPFLKRVGLLWMTNNVIPAQEHFASYIIQNKIIAKTDELPQVSETEPAIVLFSPYGEHHELPLLFIHYLLKKNGWNTIYLGPNITLEALENFTSHTTVRYFYLHLITNFTGFLGDDFFETLCHRFSNIKIIASGASISTLQRQFTNLVLLKSDEAIHQFIEHRFV